MAKAKQFVKNNKNSYTRSIEVHVVPSKVYADICDVSQWWTKSFKGRAESRGDKFKIQFGETFVDFEVIEAVPDRRIVWQVTDCYLHWVDNNEWTGTSIGWDITPANGVTTVKMTHHGLTPDDECYDSCEPGWNFYVGRSLPALLKTGDGLPDGI